MKFPRLVTMLAVLAALGVAPIEASASTAQAAENTAVQVKEGWYPHLVGLDFVRQHAVLPKPEGVMIIDSRPTARKYDRGHIPTAVNIPDSNFEQGIALLPQDKNTLLIFYCEGVDCMLSHNSAFKAEKLGYTNVKVFAEGYPAWIKAGQIGAVSVPFIKLQLDEGRTMLLVDSRPKARKYDKGHIPGAVSIPDSSFDSMIDRLPADKARALYFYCEGLACSLSSSSAEKAVKLGYTNVKVVPEGYPAWEKLYGPGPDADTPPAQPSLQSGKDEGAITITSFERMLKEAPGSMLIVDVRDEKDFAKGSFPGAINIPSSTLAARLAELPTDKPIVFTCSSGARSGEAYDLVIKEKKLPLKAYFLDATVKFGPDGRFVISES